MFSEKDPSEWSQIEMLQAIPVSRKVEWEKERWWEQFLSHWQAKVAGQSELAKWWIKKQAESVILETKIERMNLLMKKIKGNKKSGLPEFLS